MSCGPQLTPTMPFKLCPKFKMRLKQVLLFQQYIITHRMTDCPRTSYRLFFTEHVNTPLQYSCPEHATFFNVLEFNNGTGLTAHGVQWPTLEHYYQSHKFLYLKPVYQCSMSQCKQLWHNLSKIQSPDIIFKLVRMPLSAENLQKFYRHLLLQKNLPTQVSHQLCTLLSHWTRHQEIVSDINHMLIPEWHVHKNSIMLQGLYQKYNIAHFHSKLMDGPNTVTFIEGNLQDRHWGLWNPKTQVWGQNWLGRLLTQVRNEISLKQKHQNVTGSEYVCT